MNPKDNRPLSPHLSVYRWQISNTLSILHRMTGFALTFGALLFVLWLWAAAYSPELFETFQDFLTSPFGLVLLFGWSAAFYYHLANGVRHLVWDAGVGLSVPVMTRSGIAAVMLAALMTLGTWGYLFRERFL